MRLPFRGGCLPFAIVSSRYKGKLEASPFFVAFPNLILSRTTSQNTSFQECPVFAPQLP
jgi:hypothetical protein